MTDRKALNFDDLDDFEPRSPVARQTIRKSIDRTTGFPSREPNEDGQINIKAPVALLERFKAMAKAERYKHGEFLEILMDFYEKR